MKVNRKPFLSKGMMKEVRSLKIVRPGKRLSQETLWLLLLVGTLLAERMLSPLTRVRRVGFARLRAPPGLLLQVNRRSRLRDSSLAASVRWPRPWECMLPIDLPSLPLLPRKGTTPPSIHAFCQQGSTIMGCISVNIETRYMSVKHWSGQTGPYWPIAGPRSVGWVVKWMQQRGSTPLGWHSVWKADGRL